MNEQMIKKLENWVRENYKQYTTSWTAQRSEGNYDDCFSDGMECERSWCAYEVGTILGMDLEEPEDPDYDDYD